VAKGQLEQKRILGFRLPATGGFDYKIIAALLLLTSLVVMGRVAFSVLSPKSNQNTLPSPVVQLQTAGEPSALALLVNSLYMKKDHLSQADSTQRQALLQAKHDKLPDVDQLAIAQQLMETYTVDRWENARAMSVFNEVSPSLSRLTARLATSPKDGPYAYTGLAPMIYMLAARAQLQEKNYDQALLYCKKGLEMTRGQPDGPWLAARVEHMQGQILIRLKRYDEAAASLRSSMNAMMKIFGSNANHNIAEGYRFLAVIALEHGDYKRARKLTQEGIDILSKLPLENWRIPKDFAPQLIIIDSAEKASKK
jgi:tetratricopeptide (TPR) repeat protein